MTLDELVHQTSRSLGLLMGCNEREEDAKVENHEVLENLGKREVDFIVFVW